MPNNAISWTEVDVEHTARMILPIPFITINNSALNFIELYKPRLSIRQSAHSMIHSLIQRRMPRPEKYKSHM